MRTGRMAWWADYLAAIGVLIAGLMLLALTGCNVHRAADRATYRAVAPEYLEYVREDGALSEEQRVSREDTVRLWALRVGETVY